MFEKLGEGLKSLLQLPGELIKGAPAILSELKGTGAGFFGGNLQFGSNRGGGLTGFVNLVQPILVIALVIVGVVLLVKNLPAKKKTVGGKRRKRSGSFKPVSERTYMNYTTNQKRVYNAEFGRARRKNKSVKKFK